MQILLDTNIIIHRETPKPQNKNIMYLYQWMNTLKYEKLIHPYSIDEIKKNLNPETIKAFTSKMDSYTHIKTIRKPGDEFYDKIKSFTPKENDNVDNILLNEIYLDRVDYLITEDRIMLKKAELLEIRNKVFSIGEFITKCTEENPSQSEIKGLKISKEYFGNIDLNDSFFNSLKENYEGFVKWFRKKSNDEAYLAYNEDDSILGFMALKEENEDDINVEPPLYKEKRMKIRTFKTVSTGFRLGERFLKIAIDNALLYNVNEIYVTMFDIEKLQTLKGMFYKWGFNEYGRKKNGEILLIKKMKYDPYKNPRKNFPYFNAKKVNKFFLPIEPEYHRMLFPESIIQREQEFEIKDQTAARYAIQKTYISFAFDTSKPKPGDVILIYRKGEKTPKHFSSTVTAICIIKEIVNRFDNFDEFANNCENRSVFSQKSLEYIWKNKNHKTIVKLLHIKSAKRNITLGKLRELGMFSPNDGPRPFHELNHPEYLQLIEKGFK